MLWLNVLAVATVVAVSLAMWMIGRLYLRR
jgi:hypothetical protein